MMEMVLFYVLAVFAIGGAIFTVTFKNPVYSAMSLIVTMAVLAVYYLMLNAELLAALQIIVYAGAVMVLVLFVIMMLNLGGAKTLIVSVKKTKLIGIAIVGVILFELSYIITKGVISLAKGGYTDEVTRQVGNTKALGASLYTDYVFPFEVASVLLLAAMVGAIIIAKKDKEEGK